MGSIVGFTLCQGLDEGDIARAISAQQRAISYYKHLERRSIEVGRTKLEIWGHPDISDCLHRMPDGDLLALVGSPHNTVSWEAVEEGLRKAGRPEEYELPWEGRVVLLRISADGERWTMWNDWIGSIPVYHARVGQGRIASTLEPVVVAGGGYTPDDFFLPGLVSLLINGHFVSDWTLYKEMNVIPPDSVAEWEANGFHSKQLWTVEPSQARWETGWDDLVDEMYALSHQAIADVLKTQSNWVLPLSSGLDSRLIAAVGADVGANMLAYAWGSEETTDVVYSRQIARVLGIPWKHIELPRDFLVRYTPQWADWFGSSMHFHGMYQMAFLDAIDFSPAGPICSGLLGDVLAGDCVYSTHPHRSSISNSMILPASYYRHWDEDEIVNLLKIPYEHELNCGTSEIIKKIDSWPGTWFQKLLFLEIWGRSRLFTNFQVSLSDYWRGVSTPYLNRAYARFCLSLPRAALDHRRLLGSTYRRYYGRLATIPGTYAGEPFTLTGRYLLKRRIARVIPSRLQRGPLIGIRDVQLRMDVDSIQATGKAAIWPIHDVWDLLAEWVDMSRIESSYLAVMSNRDDVRPLRKLQSIQTLAYRLLDS